MTGKMGYLKGLAIGAVCYVLFNVLPDIFPLVQAIEPFALIIFSTLVVVSVLLPPINYHYKKDVIGTTWGGALCGFLTIYEVGYILLMLRNGYLPTP